MVMVMPCSLPEDYLTTGTVGLCIERLFGGGALGQGCNSTVITM